MSLLVIKQRAENDPGFQLREKLVLQVDSSDQRLHRKLIIMQIRVKQNKINVFFLNATQGPKVSVSPLGHQLRMWPVKRVTS